MRYSLLPLLASAALTAAPAMAQDVTSPTSAQPASEAEPAMAPATDAAPTPAEVVAEQADPGTTPPPEDTADPAAPVSPTSPDAASMATAATASPTTEQRATYDGWSPETKTYFDGLSPARQTLFLRIADADKAKLVGLDAAQQETVWASLEKQDAMQKDAPKR